MNAKHVLSLMLAFAMIASIFVPVVSAADSDSKGIDLNASIKEPRPEVAITVDTEAIDFGELLPGETSSSHPVAVTNVGLKPIDVSAIVEDSGSEAIFVQGITVNNGAWDEYSAQLVSDDHDSFGVALQIPGNVETRGNISGSLTVWAEAIETPVADFSASPLSGDAPLTVQFTDESVGATAWQWDFDDDGEVDSYEQNPTYIYNAPGTYTVKLTVSNAAGNGTATGTVTVYEPEPPSPVSHFKYTSSGNAITITEYIGPGGKVVIPREIDGQPVTKIGWDAFKDCYELTSVVIPNSVTIIDDYAFYCCEELTSLTVPDSVTYIGDYAFNECYSLASLTIGDSVTYIGERAFYSCFYYSIGNPTSVTIPDSVTYIDDYAFAYCSGLASVTIGSGVTYFGAHAFDNARLTSVTISYGLTTIGDYAFYQNPLTAVTIPDSVTTIGSYAFDGCYALTSLTIGNNVTTIGNCAFQNCEALTSVTIPDSVITIGNWAFCGCPLTSVTIGNSVTTIGEYAFYHTSLTSIVIPDSVTSIGMGAFHGSSVSALASVTIGTGLTTIGYVAFGSCPSLTSMVFSGNAPTTVDSSWANGSTNLVVYYHEGAEGFTEPTWNGVNCQKIA